MWCLWISRAGQACETALDAAGARAFSAVAAAVADGRHQRAPPSPLDSSSTLTAPSGLNDATAGPPWWGWAPGLRNAAILGGCCHTLPRRPRRTRRKRGATCRHLCAGRVHPVGATLCLGVMGERDDEEAFEDTHDGRGRATRRERDPHLRATAGGWRGRLAAAVTTTSGVIAASANVVGRRPPAAGGCCQALRMGRASAGTPGTARPPRRRNALRPTRTASHVRAGPCSSARRGDDGCAAVTGHREVPFPT